MREHNRHSIRLPGCDYTSPGAYFVTMVTFERESIFGKIEVRKLRLNRCGEIAAECWQVIPAYFPGVELGAFVVMPNHIHGIITIKRVGAMHALPQPAVPQPDLKDFKSGPPPRSLGAMVGPFKSAVTKRINEEFGTPGSTVWQRNYYACLEPVEGSISSVRIASSNASRDTSWPTLVSGSMTRNSFQMPRRHNDSGR